MVNIERLRVINKLKEEYMDINNNPILNIVATVGLPDENNFFEWRLSIIGPSDTPYKDGLFFLTLKFPENYPSYPPKVTFDTPIYHINVASIGGGSILGEPASLTILRAWSPNFKVRDIIISIYSLFYMNNIDCELSNVMTEEFKNNKSLYEEKIKYFTKKYANPMIGYKKYDNWDFTYNN